LLLLLLLMVLMLLLLLLPLEQLLLPLLSLLLLLLLALSDLERCEQTIRFVWCLLSARDAHVEYAEQKYATDAASNDEAQWRGFAWPIGSRYGTVPVSGVGHG
jgi:hypothetical protein